MARDRCKYAASGSMISTARCAEMLLRSPLAVVMVVMAAKLFPVLSALAARMGRLDMRISERSTEVAANSNTTSTLAALKNG